MRRAANTRWRKRRKGQEGSPDLVAYRQLTPAQLEQLRTNLRAYQDFYSARIGRINEINQGLQSEFAQDSPQPLAVGNDYWEIGSTTISRVE